MKGFVKIGAAFVGFVIVGAAAPAQTPLGPELVPADTTLDTFEQFGAEVACDDSSVCGLFWASYKPDGNINNDRLWARTISPSGQLSKIELLRADDGVQQSPIGLATDTWIRHLW
jgi:hypothetical protein